MTCISQSTKRQGSVVAGNSFVNEVTGSFGDKVTTSFKGLPEVSLAAQTSFLRSQ